MGFERVGHFAVVFFSGQAGFHDVAERAGLLKLGSAVLQGGGLPEAGQGLVLLEDLRLIGPAGEQDEERTERKDRHDGHGGLSDQTAALQSFGKTELVLGSGVGASGEDFKKHAMVLSKNSRRDKVDSCSGNRSYAAPPVGRSD